MIKKIFIFLLFFLLCSTPALAATYYVRGDGHDGSCDGTTNVSLAGESGDGDDCAWLTIAYAATQVATGNTISVSDSDGDGNTVYLEAQIVLAAGVTLTSTDTDNTSVTIKPVAPMNDGNPLVSLASGTPGSGGGQTISYLTFDGVNGGNLARQGILVTDFNDVTIDNNIIKDFKGVTNAFGVLAHGTEVAKTAIIFNYWPDDIQTTGIDDNLNALWPANPVERFILSNNTITDCGYKESATTGTSISGSVMVMHLKESTISGNIINATNSFAQPITGWGAMDAFLHDVDINNNTLTMVQYTNRSSYAIELWGFRNGCRIFENTINNGNTSLVVSKDFSIYDNTIIHSPAQNVIGAGGNIGIEASYGAELEIYGNYLEGNLGQYMTLGLPTNSSRTFTISNIVVRNNIFYNNRSHGISLYAVGHSTNSGSTHTVSNVDIYNNVLDTSRNTAGYTMLLVTEESPAGTGDLSNVNIKNNWIMNGPGYAGKIIGTVTGLDVDYNGLYNNGTDGWSGTTDSNPTIGDPLFAETGTRLIDAFAYYTPASGASPLVDAGVDVGLSYFGAEPDLGAVEYNGTPVPVITPALDPSDIDTATDSGQLSVTGTATDDNAVTDCKWRIGDPVDASNNDGDCTADVGTFDTASEAFTCATTFTVEGANTLYVGCTDAEANWGNDSIVVNFDETVPTVTAKVIEADGLVFRVTFSEIVHKGASWANNEYNLDKTAPTASADITLTYTAGDGTNTWYFDIGETIPLGAVVNFDLSATANVIEDHAKTTVGHDVAQITDGATDNQSAEGNPPTTSTVVGVSIN